MRVFLMILGAVIVVCGLVAASKNPKEKPNSALEWVLFIVGIAVFVIGLNI